ncbi:MAG: SAF domain-containing protein [Dermatophilus congolensis]|nr:SAF domain-containing protein [Dermatophilus congolensis]
MPWLERSSTPPKARSRRSLRRALVIRKAIAAGLVGCATWLALQLLGIGVGGVGSEGTVAVLVAARDLPAGHTVTASDVSSRRVAAAAVADSVREVDRSTLESGRILTGPIRGGEMLSSTRLRNPENFEGLAPDRRAVHVPLRDNGTVSLLHRGSRVDIYSTAGGRLVVGDVEILQVDSPPASGGGLGAVSSSDAAGVVVAVPVASAAAMMSALGSQSSEGGQIHLALRNH